MKHARNHCLVLIFAFVSLLSSGCGPRQAYTGPELSPSQVALIKGSYYFYGIATQELGLQDVDGMELAGWSVAPPQEVQVLPGKHDCKVRFRVQAGNSLTWTDYPLSLNVKPGVIYKLEFENYDGETYIWMNEEKTGVLVAGEKPKK